MCAVSPSASTALTSVGGGLEHDGGEQVVVIGGILEDALEDALLLRGVGRAA